MRSRSRRLLWLTASGAAVMLLTLAMPSLASAGGGVNYITNTQTGQTIVPGVTDAGNHCDDCATPVTFPFPVSVYGDSYTSGYVSSNGSLQLTTSNGGFSSGCTSLPINGLDRALIPYQDDLRTDETNDGIFTAVTGSPPNRQFVIEWRATYFQRAGTANFEVILPESSGTLSVIYGQTADNGSQETSGIQSGDNGPFTQFSCGDSTLVNGLRVNYVPTGCPVGSTMVSMGDNFYDPSTATVPVGTTVCWTNNGQISHTATSDTSVFNSGVMAPG